MSTSLAILATAAAMAALHLGRQLLAPVALALLVTALVRPVVNTLGRLRVPHL